MNDSMDNIYLSIIIVGRNDNYGGDFLQRTKMCFTTLADLCQKHRLATEVIMVEWNPPGNRPFFKEVFQEWPISNDYCTLRIIQVPPDLHRNLPNPGKLPLFEYLGKNVGICRAKGEYVLSTNPDIIHGDALIKYLASRKLSEDHFYRIDRHDVRTPVPENLTTEERLVYCENNITMVLGYWYNHNNRLVEKYHPFKRLRRYAGFVKRKIHQYPVPILHTNASGDFCLMHRSTWNELRGYPQFELLGKSHGIDGVICYMAVNAGLNQVVFKSPLRIYHQEHGRPEEGKPFSDTVKDAFAKLIHERKPITYNQDTWGLGDVTLPDETV